jgi:hypothetical protein
VIFFAAPIIILQRGGSVFVNSGTLGAGFELDTLLEAAVSEGIGVPHTRSRWPAVSRWLIPE